MGIIGNMEMKCNANEVGERAAYSKLDFKQMVARRTRNPLAQFTKA